MKKFYLLLLAVALTSVACEKHVDDKPLDKPKREECIAATERFNTLIAADGEYDITNVDRLIYGSFGYWTLDAVCRYDNDYAEVVEIVRPFDLEFWVDDCEPMLCFASGNTAYRKYLDKETFRLMRQEGVWAYEPRTLKLSFSFERVDGYEALNIEATLQALGQEAMVIDYRGEDGECYRASYVRADVELMEIREAEKMVSALMNDISDYDTESVEEQIIGTWCEDTWLSYDDEWQDVTDAIVVFGTHYWLGTGYVEYTFKEGGIVEVYTDNLMPDSAQTTINTWSFDVELKQLTITSEAGYAQEYTISGFGSGYIFMDFYDEVNKDNTRIGLKRIVEE